MSVFLARSECRGNFWHVITYDITNQNQWVQIEDLPTSQPCGEIPATAALGDVSGDERSEAFLAVVRDVVRHATLHHESQRHSIAKTKARNGHEISLEVHEDGSTILAHRDETGEIVSRTCSGKCGDQSVGPIDCPEGKSPFLNCTVNPPTLECV
jgi:hypothetical protein